MHRNNLDLIAVLLIGTLNVGWALLPNHLPFIGIALALPLVFLLPGYAVTEALFKRTPNDAKALIVNPRVRTMSTFSLSSRLVFSFGLSLVIDILTGLVLDTLSPGLNQASWAIALVTIATIFTIIATSRRQRVQQQQNRTAGFNPLNAYHISAYEYLLLALAFVITVSSVWYTASNAFQQQENTSFTQFWMVPSKQNSNTCAVLIGIQSFEATPATYHVVLITNGAPLSTWSSVQLAPHEEWYQSVPITASNSNPITLDAQLYRTDQPKTLYREVHLTLTSAGEANGSGTVC